jgi:hypothetical protein
VTGAAGRAQVASKARAAGHINNLVGSCGHLPQENNMLALYTTEKSIKDAINVFENNGKALQEEAHKIACSVLQHVGKYGDILVLRRFLDAMPDMARTNGLRLWFETFGPVTFKGNEAQYVKGGKTRLGDAIAKPFWKFKTVEGSTYEPIDPNTVLNALIKKFEKDAEKTQRDHSATILALKHVPIWTEAAAEYAEFTEVREFSEPLQIEYRVVN